MIPAPHGGRLIDRQLPSREVERRLAELPHLPKLYLDSAAALDAEKIGTGAYSPLDGFVDEDALEHVVKLGRLPGGLPWPVPVFLAPSGRENARTVSYLNPGDDAALMGPDGEFFAVLHLRQKFRLPKNDIARLVYETTNPGHPDVAALETAGDVALGGRVDLLRAPPFVLPDLELTPASMREMFRARGWRTVAAYHTRSVPHLGHEQMQRLTLERSDVDGLLVHPVVGPTRRSEDRPEVVIAAYRALIDGYYPASRVALATLSLPIRHAGPRGALFLAIVRQNYGCSHYVVGRDQAGVGDFYDPYACHRIFDNFPLEITPIRYRELGYCVACRGMVSEKTCGHGPEHRFKTDRSLVRRAIHDLHHLPGEILRPEVRELLQDEALLRPPWDDAGRGAPPAAPYEPMPESSRKRRDSARTAPAG